MAVEVLSVTSSFTSPFGVAGILAPIIEVSCILAATKQSLSPKLMWTQLDHGHRDGRIREGVNHVEACLITFSSVSVHRRQLGCRRKREANE
jgi:hypothetical protein